MLGLRVTDYAQLSRVELASRLILGTALSWVEWTRPVLTAPFPTVGQRCQLGLQPRTTSYGYKKGEPRTRREEVSVSYSAVRTFIVSQS